MNLKQSVERFYKTTKMHKLSVVSKSDEFLYLAYKMGDFSSYGANIVVTNEIVSVYGDVGCYVFKIDDESPIDGIPCLINEVDLDKMANCCISVDVIFPICDFNFKSFKKNAIKYASKYCDEKGLSEDEKIELIDDINFTFDDDELFGYPEVTESECVEFINSYEYEFEHGKGTFMFPAKRMFRFGDYNMNFVWCCYAIHEALKLYVEQKKI